MRDKLNFIKGDVMKTAILSLVTVTMLFLTGCSQKAPMVSAEEGKARQHAKTEIANVNDKDFIDEQALHDAVRAKDMDQVTLLISKGSDINFKDYYGYNPLHLAVRLNQFEISEYLIAHGADINNLDNYQDTPLLDSTRDNYTNLSKLLICNGAERRVADRYDMTPLHYSAKNKNKLISEMLLAKDLIPYCKKDAGDMGDDMADNAMNNEADMTGEGLDSPVVNELPLAQTPEFKGLYQALMEEFKDDFEPWNAELTKDDLMFRFNDPVTLFERGSDDLKPGFANILNDFFPRYLKVLSQYQENIQEVRVEGHTSSEWSGAKTEADRYRLNKNLSVKRANAVRDFSVGSVQFDKGSTELKPDVAKTVSDTGVDGVWVEDTFQPYGMSYDNLILNPDGTENKEASRRVDFKIMKK